MASPESILARATAKGGQYEQYVGGGLAAFTSAQVGHFLAGLKRGDKDFAPLPDAAVRILLLKYADGDERDAEELVKDMLDDAGKVHDWVAYAAHTAICKTVFREFMSARRCGVCEGRTTVKRANLVEQCKDCDATGYKPHSDTSRAKECGVPYSAFRNGPAERYYVARLRKLHQWESNGLQRVVAKGRAGMVLLSSHDERILQMLAKGRPARLSYTAFEKVMALPIIKEEVRWIPDRMFGYMGVTSFINSERAMMTAARDLLSAAGFALE